ncbi:Predicted methyltransferase, contains TPR repeat [Pseudovibrio ascidiaceicola]|uniref:Predicted methyltransferase, contains TPR repeat n=1 Tax=Pseudovibrio ascidiaceicola TaxID=285279 RepID=A0A1I3V2H3_9HYPH|nr:methyltransferase domain-containing protein [Pseudovibrio ascidiaceicola]SFJ89159.1 Predicted methyltransferase, contains TPR repeat [Pseudovibrio ascidiaceicola]
MKNDKKEQETNPVADFLRHFVIYDHVLNLKETGEFNGAADHLLNLLGQGGSESSEDALDLPLANANSEKLDSMPAEYVSALFDQKAKIFDIKLLEILQYSLPTKIHEKITTLNLGPFKRLLDLGCGTGLAAELFEDQIPYKTGVDISEEMLKLAKDKEIYDDLQQCEINEFLDQDHPQKWDLIIASELFPYFGSLEDLFAGVAHNIEKNGVFLFSAEAVMEPTSDTPPYIMSDSCRFTHTENYLRNLLKQFDFAVIDFTQTTLRQECENPVRGHLVVARHIPK